MPGWTDQERRFVEQALYRTRRLFDDQMTALMQCSLHGQTPDYDAIYGWRFDADEHSKQRIPLPDDKRNLADAVQWLMDIQSEYRLAYLRAYPLSDPDMDDE